MKASPRQVLRFLDASIRHWERICAGGEKDSPSGLQCSLCRNLGCDNCPIYAMTHKVACCDTPFYDAVAEFPPPGKACRAELAFLRKVRKWWIRTALAKAEGK